MKFRGLIAGAFALAFSTTLALAQGGQGTSPLSGSKGGTNNAFMQFTGPATSIKTYTLPNATDTIATLTASQTLTNKTFDCNSNTCTVRIASDVTGLGTGVATALGVNVGSAGAFVTFNGALGTPSSGTLTNATGLPVSTGISGLGTGVATALAVNVGSAGAPVVFNGALGTPSSGTLTNATGLPVSTGISGLGTGVATWLATPSSANLISAVTDETGTGALVFGTSPSLTTPNLGTPSAATLTNATGLPISTGVSGLGTGVATALGVNVGSAGAFVTFNGALGTPSSGTLTNATGLPVSTGISGLGTGIATWLATPSSANLISALTDETGTGSAVFGTSPTISAPTVSGLANFSGARRDSTQSAPSQITANQNDYNPSSVVCATSSTLLINSDAARDITGIAGGVAGCDLFLINNGSFTITLKDGSASSTAGNRFDFGADFELASKSTAHLKYDGTASRWRNASGAGGGGGSGTVTSVTCNGGATVITTSGTCASREILSANRTYYVATTGSDSNTGMASATTGTITFTNGNDNIGWTGHGRSVGDTLVFTTTGTLPTNFATLTIYFVKTVVDVDTIEVAATSGGAAISAGSAGSGTHTATLLSPFLTIQKSIDVAAALDTSIYSVTIYVSGGTYTAANTLKRPVGGGDVTIAGMGASLTTVSVTSDHAFYGPNCGSYAINSMKLATTTSGTAIFLTGALTSVTGTGLEFGASVGHVRVSSGASLRLYAYTISGGAGIHVLAEYQGRFTSVSVTNTLTGTPAFTNQFIKAQKGAIVDVEGVTWSGSATGTRYICDTNSVINTATGSSTALPGNAAGTASTGCQYTSLEAPGSSFARMAAANDNSLRLKAA